MQLLSEIEQRAIIARLRQPSPEEPPPNTADLVPGMFTGQKRQWIEAYKANGQPVASLDPILSSAEWAAINNVAADKTGAELLDETLRQRWELLGITDLLRPPEPPKYLIHRMIRKPALVAAYGSPGDLKSMLLMDLAVCVASGQPWLAPMPEIGSGGAYALTQCPVLWLDQDNGRALLVERFGALCRTRKVDQAPLSAISLPRPAFDASKVEEADLLAAQIRRLGAGLCVVDNLGTVSGGRDENSSQMVDVMGNLRWVAESTGAVLVVVHHARKGNNQAGGRDGDRLRGHSSIEASLDLAILIERDGDDITVRSTKTRNDPVRPFRARWTWEQDEHGTLQAARFWHLERLETIRPKYLVAADELPDILGDMEGRPNQTQLCERLRDAYGLSRAQARRAIEAAVRSGKVREEAENSARNAPRRYEVA